MTLPKYVRPAGAQSATHYKVNIDASAKVFERFLGAFHAHQQDFGSPSPDMTVRVEGGPVLADGGSPLAPILAEVAAQTVSGFTIPSAGQFRIDRVVRDPNTGACSRVAGLAGLIDGGSAQADDIPAGYLPVAQVTILDTDTAITNSMITDERSFGDLTKGRAAVDGVDFLQGKLTYNAGSPGFPGVTDSPKGTVFGFFRMDAQNNLDFTLLSGAGGGGGFGLSRQVNAGIRTFRITTTSPSGQAAINFESTSDHFAPTGWMRVLASWDNSGSPGTAWIRVNDVLETNITAMQSGLTIDYTVADWTVACGALASSALNGCMAELWFAPGQYIEDTAVNRRRFYDANGRPITLGPDGSWATGTAPMLYLHLDDGEALENFYVNRGSGGGTFTFSFVAGSPQGVSIASTSPSD